MTRKTRKTKFLGVYVPPPLATAISRWVAMDPERDVAQFMRNACREKLKREGMVLEDPAHQHTCTADQTA